MCKTSDLNQSFLFTWGSYEVFQCLGGQKKLQGYGLLVGISTQAHTINLNINIRTFRKRWSFISWKLCRLFNFFIKNILNKWSTHYVCINLFSTNVPLLYPLKTLDVFRGYRSESLVENGLKTNVSFIMYYV